MKTTLTFTREPCSNRTFPLPQTHRIRRRGVERAGLSAQGMLHGRQRQTCDSLNQVATAGFERRHRNHCGSCE